MKLGIVIRSVKDVARLSKVFQGKQCNSVNILEKDGIPMTEGRETVQHRVDTHFPKFELIKSRTFSAENNTLTSRIKRVPPLYALDSQNLKNR